MLRVIDSYLNRITMYRLVLYYLIILLALAAVFGAFGLLHYGMLAILFSSLFFTAVCWLANSFFARMYKVPANAESFLITALILALIISPPASAFDKSYFEIALWASVLAMASKYILTVGRKHIFNPAAFAVVITAYALGSPASWWVGTQVMLPAVVLGGLIVARKILRFDLVLSFLAAALVSVVGAKLGGSLAFGTVLSRLAFDTPVLFVAFVMLTEPLTTPPTRGLRIAYGLLAGFLYAPWIHIGSVYSTPELTLLAGNLFSYAVSPKYRLVLALREKTAVARDVFDFHFSTDKKISFTPGQYLEWTLAGGGADSRGNRRYFTIASSPTEDEIILGVKFHAGPSTFKQKLKAMAAGDTIVAGQLAGDFTLPKDKHTKLAFIAGGIGVTPFRSMIKALSDAGEKRDVVMFYSNRTADEIAYREIFDEARTRIGLKTVYALTDTSNVPQGFDGHAGRIDAALLAKELPDYKERHFYISGPRSMIDAYKKLLKENGVPASRIKEDFFPGFA